MAEPVLRDDCRSGEPVSAEGPTCLFKRSIAATSAGYWPASPRCPDWKITMIASVEAGIREPSPAIPALAGISENAAHVTAGLCYRLAGERGRARVAPARLSPREGNRGAHAQLDAIALRLNQRRQRSSGVRGAADRLATYCDERLDPPAQFAGSAKALPILQAVHVPLPRLERPVFCRPLVETGNTRSLRLFTPQHRREFVWLSSSFFARCSRSFRFPS